MKFIRTFEQYNTGISLYDKKWESFLPHKITVLKGGNSFEFTKGNALLNADWINITYENHLQGEPNNLMFDVYYAFDENSNSVKLDVDITYGDLMVSEFTINAPNKITVGQSTSYGSKFDPSNTEFALDSNAIHSLINYFNAFDHGIHLTFDDLNFLSHSEDPTNKIC